ncbi:purine-nucleoside phosphorylase [Rathayibacter sp. AY2B7]|uniref:purine-nucleoside phosphorylase n=1 Tax=Rathayibacter sp. AY2B7 TaxID=2080571 RepID=UPI000CE7A25D|nr:purine-nucleoside phosphorylase [Rathayibacter sp. AY2B7]PPG64410.1 purine-nucleoside phosphorylase [Rathayibacter sp. AY2B7]
MTDTLSPQEMAGSAASAVREATGISSVDLAVTLGSGWRSADQFIGETVAVLDASAVPGFRSSPVPGHASVLKIMRTPRGATILIIGARTHLYEGHGVAAVVHGVRTAAALGARTVVLTNGAGAVTPRLTPGRAVLIRDHLNLTSLSPLVGAEFVDLTDLYSSRLRRIAQGLAPELGEGVYAQLPGPHYETPAEVRMLETLGADVVGMSTALEAIAARHVGLDVCALSLVTNFGAGLQTTALNHREVLEAGATAEHTLGPLLARIIDAIATGEPK